MRKYLFIIGIIVLVFSTACSGGDDSKTPKSLAEDSNFKRASSIVAEVEESHVSKPDMFEREEKQMTPATSDNILGSTDVSVSVESQSGEVTDIEQMDNKSENALTSGKDIGGLS